MISQYSKDIILQIPLSITSMHIHVQKQSYNLYIHVGTSEVNETILFYAR